MPGKKHSNHNPSSYRKMGQILVERGSITPDQLQDALRRQQETGQLLGEVCVELWGIDRLALADALSEHWDEMRPALARGASADPTSASGEADELRVLLEEAEAARAELSLKTDELSRRLAILEMLVIGVGDALKDLRPAS